MTAYLLDTNILSAIIRKEDVAERRFRQAINNDETLLLSVVVLYEIKRGLLKHAARKQMATFEHLIVHLAWCETLHADWELAAHLWATREKIGRPIEDADLLIAAQVKRLSATLVTDNEKDFANLGIEIENWRRK